MNFVVVVLDPVPEDLSAATKVVAERFRIGEDKARALLARTPGAVTKAVPESQARTVADILHQAGLRVELRAGDVEGPATPYPGPVAEVPEGSGFSGVDAEAADQTASDHAARDPEATGHGADDAHSMGPAASEDGAFAPASAAGAAAATTDAAATDAAAAAAPAQEVRPRPEPGSTTTTPPRDPMKTTLTREPPDLERSGLRRRIGTAATLPAILTLLVTLLALAATLLPVLRAQQARRAADTVAAVAATIEGLSGGLPLSAPLIRAELRQVEERTRAQLAPRGIAYMAVADRDGTLLLEWSTRGSGPGSLTPEQAAAVAAAAEASADLPGATRGSETIGENLRASWRTLLAMVGLDTEEPLLASSAIRRGGAPAGAVVLALDPSGLRAQLGQVLLTTLLVGLIPVLFAVLAALSLTRGIRDAIRYLLVATDRISHGDFERPVDLQRDDELGQIAAAVERMRVSLRESMERLRRRR